MKVAGSSPSGQSVTKEAGRRSLYDRLGIAVISSRPGSWFFRKWMHRVDRPLLRLSRGRISLASSFPVLLLTTTGAKSGKPRTVPLLYVPWEDGVAVIGSRFGTSRHPGWYHNLRANPTATVEIKGDRRVYTAREADDDERATIWREASRMYPGYDAYAARAGRKIPVIVLSPATNAQEGHDG